MYMFLSARLNPGAAFAPISMPEAIISICTRGTSSTCRCRVGPAVEEGACDRDSTCQPHDDLPCISADLVPVYHLGQTQLLTFWGTESISRSWRMSVGLFWGAYGLPLPRKSQIISLVGAPIPGEHFPV